MGAEKKMYLIKWETLKLVCLGGIRIMVVDWKEVKLPDLSDL